jgi:integrase
LESSAPTAPPARLGHADPAITLRVYAHVIRTAEAAAADVFAQAVNAA